MAQPTGQVLLDAAGPNYAATSFWYAQSTGMWDAKAGAMATKSGTGAVVAEGGANVLTSSGTTYITLSSAQLFTGDFTLAFKARSTGNNTDSMVAGDRNGSANFIWLNNGSSQTAIRVAGGTWAASNASSTTMATYCITRESGSLLLYKNGAFVGSMGFDTGTFVLAHLLAGYSGGSFSLNGALEFFHAINGVALDAAAVASYYADPYQGLVAAAGVDATAAGVAVTASSSFIAGAASGGVGNSITLTSPAPYQGRQRSLVTGLTDLPFAVSLAYTGSPTGFDYRFSGGAWTALPGTPTGGSFSTTVHLPVGQGTFEIRFRNDTSVTDWADYVTVGDGYIPAGQSNHRGTATSKVDPVFTNFVVVKLGRDGVWKPLTESTTQAGSFDEAVGAAGSYFGALSTRLQAVGVPVFFIPTAQGSTYITDWERYDPDPTNPVTLYGDMRQADIAAGGHRSVLWLQGESEAANGVAGATYQTKLDGIVTDWAADTGGKFFIVQIVRWSSAIYAQIDAIRAAQAAVAASNPNVAGVADGNVWQSANDVHYQTTTHINDLADVVYAGMVPAFYGVSASATGATWTAVVSLLPGSAAGQRSASVPGATLLATASLLPGAAGGGSSAVVGGTTWLATATLLAGAAAGGAAAAVVEVATGADQLSAAVTKLAVVQEAGASLESQVASKVTTGEQSENGAPLESITTGTSLSKSQQEVATVAEILSINMVTTLFLVESITIEDAPAGVSASTRGVLEQVVPLDTSTGSPSGQGVAIGVAEILDPQDRAEVLTYSTSGAQYRVIAKGNIYTVKRK